MSNAQTIESPYLTAGEAAIYLRYSTPEAFRLSVKKFGIPCLRRGRRMFFTKAALDQFMSVASEATKGARKFQRAKKKAH